MKVISAGLLEEIVERLAAEFQPEQIILFGSHAWGAPTEDSDLDLLVVVTESPEKESERMRRAYRCLQGLGVSKDVLVKTRREVERFRRVAASLEARILNQGKVIYERGKEPARA
ncbi:MAG: nucleotidyltransferase domain-containing protein [Planctomycetes bacterium]|nr:nucleotidyltransferase domain-containing protein [Planctomycetota bacterium]